MMKKFISILLICVMSLSALPWPGVSASQVADVMYDDMDMGVGDLGLDDEIMTDDGIGYDDSAKEPAPVPVAESADTVRSGTCGEDLIWRLQYGVLTISGKGAMYDYNMGNSIWRKADRIIEIVVKKGVTYIGNYAFDNCHEVVRVTLPDTVTAIGKGAFSACLSLKEVILPEGLTSIGERAFAGCSMEYVYIPSTLTDISTAFEGCGGLMNFEVAEDNRYYRDVDGVLYSKDMLDIVKYPPGRTDTAYAVPEGVNIVRECAFNGSDHLQYVELPYTVYTIKDHAFEGCSQLKRIKFPKAIYSIPEYCFCNCGALEEIELPETVRYIESGAFLQCYSLRTVTFPKKLFGIKESAFANCYEFTDVELPDTLMSIGRRAFAECYRLRQITIPNSVVQIDEKAFTECINLDRVELPDSLKEIGPMLFSFCSELKSITVPDSVKDISQDSFPYGITLICNKGSYCEKYAKENDINAVIIGETVQGEDGICWSYDGMGVLRIDGNGDMPDYGAGLSSRVPWYDYRYVITSVVIGEGITSVGEYAFYDCVNITDVSLPEGIDSIGRYAFYDCIYLDNINFPDTLDEIGEYAFCHCSSLIGADLSSTSLDRINKFTFKGCAALESVTLPDTLTRICDSAFSGCSSLGGISIPAGVSEMADNATSGCSSLGYIDVAEGNTVYLSKDGVLYDAGYTTLLQYPSGKADARFVIPDEIQTLRKNAFADAVYLTEVAVGKGVTHITESAFENCDALVSIELSDSVVSIGEKAFFDCQSLASVDFPDSVTELADMSFAYCSSLADITFGTGITSIPSHAFAFCDSVTDLHIGECVVDIGSDAFHDCDAIERVYIPASVKNIGHNAFGGMFLTNDEGLEVIFGCDSIKEFIVSPDNANYSSIDGVLYNKDGTVLIQFPTAREDERFVIPDTVTEIADEAFIGCMVEGVETGKGITSVGPRTFAYCTMLKRVIINGSVTDIDPTAFEGSDPVLICDPLSYAWEYGQENRLLCSDSYAIGYGICGDDIIWYADNTGRMILTGTGEIYDYDTPGALPWYDIRDSIASVEIDDRITTLPDHTFGGFGLLERIDLNAGIQSIGEDTFTGCDALTIYCSRGSYAHEYACRKGIKYHVYEIIAEGRCGDNATWTLDEEGHLIISGSGATKNSSVNPWPSQYDEKIISVTVEEGITSIGNLLFADCPALVTVLLPDSVESVGKGAFKNCDNLIEIKLPKGVKTIAAHTFNGCSAMREIIFPTELEIIDNYAFYGCKALTDVAANSKLSHIGKKAFFGCVSLKQLVFTSPLKSIGSKAFADCPDINDIYFFGQIESADNDLFDQRSSLTVHCPVGSAVMTSIKEGLCNFDYTNKAVSLTLVKAPDRKIYPLNGEIDAAGIVLHAVCDDGTEVTFGRYGIDSLHVDLSAPGGRVAYAEVTGQRVCFPVYVDGNISDYPESAHPYGSSNTQKFVYPYKVDSLKVRFSEECSLNAWGSIKVSDINGNVVGMYTGTTLAGKEVIVKGRSFTVTLTANGANENYGYAVTDVSPVCDHTFGSYTADGNATCGAEGTESALCDKGCGYADVRFIEGEYDDSKHDFEWSVTRLPRALEDGVETGRCTWCGCTEERSIPLSDKPYIMAEGYNVMLSASSNIKNIRYAYGRYTTSKDIKEAPDCVHLDNIVIGNNSVDDIFTRTVNKTGYYSFWTKSYEGVEYIYNVYVPGIPTQYTLTFDTDGGTLPAGYAYAYTIEEGDGLSRIIGVYPVPIKAGYVFEGWMVNDTLLTEKQWYSAVYRYTDDVTLKAVWSHTHTYAERILQEKSCTEDGITEFRCICGDSYTEVITASHSYGEYTSNGDATCMADGTMSATCSVCGAVDTVTDEGSRREHEYDVYISDGNATCTDDGTKTAVCIYGCMTVDTVTDEGSALGHSFGEWQTVKEPTYTETGLEQRVCGVCAATDDRELPVIDFDTVFDDVDYDSWYAEGVNYCVMNGYFSGVGQGLFCPDDPLTREQFLLVLAKLDGAPLEDYAEGTAFTDVPEGQWYTAAVNWAADMGYTGGIGGGMFGLGQQITREQFSKFFWNYADDKGEDTGAVADLGAYVDAHEISDWAEHSVAWAVKAGLISGTSSEVMMISPKGVATRAQAARIFMLYDTNF